MAPHRFVITFCAFCAERHEEQVNYLIGMNLGSSMERKTDMRVKRDQGKNGGSKSKPLLTNLHGT